MKIRAKIDMSFNYLYGDYGNSADDDIVIHAGDIGEYIRWEDELMTVVKFPDLIEARVLSEDIEVIK